MVECCEGNVVRIRVPFRCLPIQDSCVGQVVDGPVDVCGAVVSVRGPDGETISLVRLLFYGDGFFVPLTCFFAICPFAGIVEFRRAAIGIGNRDNVIGCTVITIDVDIEDTLAVATQFGTSCVRRNFF